MCLGVSVHQYSSRSGLWHLRGSEDPSGNLDWPVSGSPSAAGETAVWSRQEHKTPVGGKRGEMGADLWVLHFGQHRSFVQRVKSLRGA